MQRRASMIADMIRECRMAYMSGRLEILSAMTAELLAQVQLPKTTTLTLTEFLSIRACQSIGKSGSSRLRNEKADRARYVFKMLFHAPGEATLTKISLALDLLRAKYKDNYLSVLKQILLKPSRKHPEQILSLAMILAALGTLQSQSSPGRLCVTGGCLLPENIDRQIIEQRTVHHYVTPRMESVHPIMTTEILDQARTFTQDQIMEGVAATGAVSSIAIGEAVSESPYNNLKGGPPPMVVASTECKDLTAEGLKELHIIQQREQMDRHQSERQKIEVQGLEHHLEQHHLDHTQLDQKTDLTVDHHQLEEYHHHIDDDERSQLENSEGKMVNCEEFSNGLGPSLQFLAASNDSVNNIIVKNLDFNLSQDSPPGEREASGGGGVGFIKNTQNSYEGESSAITSLRDLEDSDSQDNLSQNNETSLDKVEELKSSSQIKILAAVEGSVEAGVEGGAEGSAEGSAKCAVEAEDAPTAPTLTTQPLAGDSEILNPDNIIIPDHVLQEVLRADHLKHEEYLKTLTIQESSPDHATQVKDHVTRFVVSQVASQTEGHGLSKVHEGHLDESDVRCVETNNFLLHADQVAETQVKGQGDREGEVVETEVANLEQEKMESSKMTQHLLLHHEVTLSPHYLDENVVEEIPNAAPEDAPEPAPETAPETAPEAAPEAIPKEFSDVEEGDVAVHAGSEVKGVFDHEPEASAIPAMSEGERLQPRSILEARMEAVASAEEEVIQEHDIKQKMIPESPTSPRHEGSEYPEVEPANQDSENHVDVTLDQVYTPRDNSQNLIFEDRTESHVLTEKVEEKDHSVEHLKENLDDEISARDFNMGDLHAALSSERVVIMARDAESVSQAEISDDHHQISRFDSNQESESVVLPPPAWPKPNFYENQNSLSELKNFKGTSVEIVQVEDFKSPEANQSEEKIWSTETKEASPKNAIPKIASPSLFLATEPASFRPTIGTPVPESPPNLETEEGVHSSSGTAHFAVSQASDRCLLERSHESGVLHEGAVLNEGRVSYEGGAFHEGGVLHEDADLLDHPTESDWKATNEDCHRAPSPEVFVHFENPPVSTQTNLQENEKPNTDRSQELFESSHQIHLEKPPTMLEPHTETRSDSSSPVVEPVQEPDQEPSTESSAESSTGSSAGSSTGPSVAKNEFVELSGGDIAAETRDELIGSFSDRSGAKSEGTEVTVGENLPEAVRAEPSGVYRLAMKQPPINYAPEIHTEINHTEMTDVFQEVISISENCEARQKSEVEEDQKIKNEKSSAEIISPRNDLQNPFDAIQSPKIHQAEKTGLIEELSEELTDVREAEPREDERSANAQEVCEGEEKIYSSQERDEQVDLVEAEEMNLQTLKVRVESGMDGEQSSEKIAVVQNVEKLELSEGQNLTDESEVEKPEGGQPRKLDLESSAAASSHDVFESHSVEEREIAVTHESVISMERTSLRAEAESVPLAEEVLKKVEEKSEEETAAAMPPLSESAALETADVSEQNENPDLRSSELSEQCHDEPMGLGSSASDLSSSSETSVHSKPPVLECSSEPLGGEDVTEVNPSSMEDGSLACTDCLQEETQAESGDNFQANRSVKVGSELKNESAETHKHKSHHDKKHDQRDDQRDVELDFNSENVLEVTESRGLSASCVIPQCSHIASHSSVKLRRQSSGPIPSERAEPSEGTENQSQSFEERLQIARAACAAAASAAAASTASLSFGGYEVDRLVSSNFRCSEQIGGFDNSCEVHSPLGFVVPMQTDEPIMVAAREAVSDSDSWANSAEATAEESAFAKEVEMENMPQRSKSISSVIERFSEPNSQSSICTPRILTDTQILREGNSPEVPRMTCPSSESADVIVHEREACESEITWTEETHDEVQRHEDAKRHEETLKGERQRFGEHFVETHHTLEKQENMEGHFGMRVGGEIGEGESHGSESSRKTSGAPRIQVRNRLAEIVIPAHVTPRTADQLEALMEVDIVLSKAKADVWHNQLKYLHGNTFIMSHGRNISAQVALSLVKSAMSSGKRGGTEGSRSGAEGSRGGTEGSRGASGSGGGGSRFGAEGCGKSHGGSEDTSDNFS